MGRNTRLRLRSHQVNVTYVTKSPLALTGVVTSEQPLIIESGVPSDVTVKFVVTHEADINRLIRFTGKVELENEGEAATEGLKIEAKLQAQVDDCQWSTLECLVLNTCCGELKPQESVEIPFSYDLAIESSSCYRAFRVLFSALHRDTDDEDENTETCNKPAKKHKKLVGPTRCVELLFNPDCVVVEDLFQFCSKDPFISLSSDTFQVTKSVTRVAGGYFTGTITGELILPNDEVVSYVVPYIVTLV